MVATMKQRISHRLFLAACVVAGTLASGAAHAKPSARPSGKAEKASKVSKPSKLSVRKTTGVRRSESSSDKPCPVTPQPPVDLPDPGPDDFNPGGSAPLSLGVINRPIDKEGGLFGKKGKVAAAPTRADSVVADATTRPVSDAGAEGSREVAATQRAVHAANVRIAQDDLPTPVVSASR
jgi:hypothetical protein